MALVDVADDCACPEQASFVNLDKIRLMMTCVSCGGFKMGTVADLDTLIEILTKLRERRFHGQVMEDASGARHVRRAAG